MRAFSTNVFQRQWEWQEDRPTDLQPAIYRYKTAFMASLYVKTAFDVAKPSLVSKILTLTGVHGHLIAALLAEMQDVWRSACSVLDSFGRSCTMGPRCQIRADNYWLLCVDKD